jgi:glutamine amidotransferase
MVSIIDYGMGNLRSVRNALNYLGVESRFISDPADVLTSARLILPGVGSFRQAVTNLDGLGLVEPIRSAGAQGMPILGICLGMQLLANQGDEGGGCEGIGLIPGVVKRLDEGDNTLKIPHMGFNQVRFHMTHPLFSGVNDASDFYFAHSYRFICEERNTAATTTYGASFAAVVAQDNVVGVQFHPEKSQVHGLTLLRNFCEWPGC